MRNRNKNIIVFCIGVVSFLYIINPGAGFIEIIPDNMPFVGNLDEASATLLLLKCLRYFDFDVCRAFEKERVTREPGEAEEAEIIDA